MPPEVNLTLYGKQGDFLQSKAPFVGFVGGRGSGKSNALAARLLVRAYEDPGLYGMYGPTFRDLHDTIQRTFLERAGPLVLRHNLSDDIITLKSGSEIICRSLDDPDHARGPSLRGAVWDEASLCKELAFDILIACLRHEGRMGWLGCGFTPKGPKHWTAKVFNDPERQDVETIHARTQENPFLPPGFYELLRRQYTSLFAEQELEGLFLEMSGKVFGREWFEIVPEAPAQLDRRCRFWDLAATPVQAGDNGNADWTAGALLGIADGVWYILDMRHDRLAPAGNEALIRQTAILDSRETPVRMEQEPGASGKSLVDHYARHVLVGFDFDGVLARKDKLLRAQPFAAAAERGNVKIVAGPWNKDLLDELTSFGVECEHDDQVDALSGAFEFLADRYIQPSVEPTGGYYAQQLASAEKRIADLVDGLEGQDRLEAERILANMREAVT